MGPALLSVSGRVLLLILLGPLGKSWASFITVQSFTCTHSEDLCKSILCNIDVSRNRVPMINCGCLLPHPMYNVELKLQSMKAGRYETFVQGKEDMCSIATRSVRGQIITRVFESITKYFNGFQCPFQGNVTATNIPLSLSFAPGFMPASDYRLLADVQNGPEFMLGAELKFSIKRTKFLSGK